MKNSKLLLGISGLVVLMLQVNITWAATAGHAQFVNGAVTLTTASGAKHALQKGEAVNEGDTVSTSRNASAQIKMQDGGFIAVRPDTQLKFDSFIFTGKAGAPERSFFSLFKGGFRAVTGLIGRVKRQDYRVTTPVATIGIRGTDHETIYLPTPVPGAAAGAYSKVNIGETSLTTNKGSIVVQPNQMGFAGGLNQAPQLQPINTTIFTVAAAPTKTIKESKEERKDSDTAAGDTQKPQVAAEAGGGTKEEAEAVEPVRETAVVDNTKLAANVSTSASTSTGAGQTETATVTPTVETVTQLPVTASSGGLTLDVTQETVTSGNTTVSVQDGIYSVQAKTAADAALAAANAAATAAGATNFALLVDTVPATSAIGNSTVGATLAVNNAAANVTTANAITLTSTISSATANASSAQTWANTTAGLASAAQTAINTNGTFADTTAITANNAINTVSTGAAALVQSNNALVQAAVTTTLPAQNTALSAAQSAATTALGNIATAGTALGDLTAANNELNSANNQNGIITTKQGILSAAGVTGITTVQLAVTAASNAAAAANTAAGLAASAQAAGNLTAAQGYLATAQAELAKAQAAQAIVDAALAANTAVTNAVALAGTATSYAGTVFAQLTAAQTAQTNANDALALTVAATTGTPANIVQTEAVVVAANAPIAAYNNPAVVSGNFFGHFSMPAPVTTSSYNIANESNSIQQANTQFVLDGNGSLVEMRHSPFEIRPVESAAVTSIADANIKWSGGTDADTFKLADNSIYGGRWVGATVTVTDLATTPVAPFSLTPASSLWAVLLNPTAGYVQTLVGTTNYTKIAATQPFDVAGNLGTLISATLTADFTSQLVNAALNLTMPTGSMAGTYDITSNNMPLDISGGFGGGAAFSVINCTTGTCAAGPTGYSADVGGSFAGVLAASAGLGYDIWPTVAAGSPVTDLVQGLVAFTADTTPTGPTNPAAGSYHSDFIVPMLTAGGYVMGAQTQSPPTSHTNFLLDGTGNLVKSLNATFGGDVYSIANANITWSGGTVGDYYQSVNGNVTLGRWQGGSMNVTDLSSAVAPFSISLAQTGGMVGPTSSLWEYVVAPPSGYIQTLVGTSSYTKTGNTTPFDSQGGTGVLNSASLTADFTNQMVSATLNLTMNTGPFASDVFDMSASMIPINPSTAVNQSRFKANASSVIVVNCTVGPCTGASFDAALIGSSFVGADAIDAVLGYGIWPMATASDIISGYVAFSTATAPTVNPAGPLAAYVATNTSVAYTGAYGGAFNFIAAPGELTPTGNPTTFIESYGDGSGFRSDTLSGASTTTPPATTANGITFGVWETVTSVDSSEQHRIEPGSGGMLPVFMYGVEGYLDSAVTFGTSTGPLIGVFNYTSVATTSFESDTWAAGSVTTATMSANFTSQTVDVSLAGTMGTDSWALNSSNLPINFNDLTNGAGAQFFDDLPTLTLNSASCPTCDGHIGGAFVEQNYGGAIVQYGFYNNDPAQGMNAGGLVAFSRNATVTPGTPAPTGAYVVADTWQIETQTAITADGSNVLTGWSNPGSSWTVAPAAGSVATVISGGGYAITWGTWAAGSVGDSSFSYNPGFGQFHWITAPEPTPVYLAEVLTTTNAVYNYVDGDVTSLSGGVHGTISSASITANFTTQTVAANLDLAVNGHSWLASTSNAPLEFLNSGMSMTGFSADSYRSPSAPGYLMVTVDGTGANGNLSGQLVGAALDGAFLKFNLDGPVAGPSYEWVQGVAALGAAVANDPATPYRIVGTSMSDPTAPVPSVMVGGAYNNAARVVTDGSGNLTQFDDNSGGDSGFTIQHVSGTFADQGSVTIGSDTISWGRWDAGTVATVTDRATGSSQSVTLTGGAHAVVGPIMTGPVSLPVSGSYTYNKIGNTLPTNDAGVAGTLNSATLSANFTAQTVDVGVNVTAGGATLDAAATSVPIQQRATFFTDSMMTGPGALAVTCTAGACGTTNHGAIGGGFGGPGGVVAAITYGFEKQGTNAGTVSGVAVFQR